MLEIQIWLPTVQLGKPLKDQDKNKVKAVIKSFLDDQNVGHANLLLTIDKKHKYYEEFLNYAKKHNIPYEEETTFKGKSNEINTLKISLSAWPDEYFTATVFAKDLVGKGMKTIFSTDKADHIREGKNKETIHDLRIDDREKQTFKSQAQQKIEKITRELNLLKQKLGETKGAINELINNNTNDEEAKEKKTVLLKTLSSEMEKINKQMIEYNKNLDELHVEEKRVRQEGAQPDHKIPLPTASFEQFHFNEYTILTKIKELLDTQYSPLRKNCAYFVRACILASMPPEMIAAIKSLKDKNGKSEVDKDFFTSPTFDIPQNLQEWTCALEGYLSRLNSPIPEENASKLSPQVAPRLTRTEKVKKGLNNTFFSESPKMSEEAKIKRVKSLIIELNIEFNQISDLLNINKESKSKKKLENFKNQLSAYTHPDSKTFLDISKISEYDVGTIKPSYLHDLLNMIGDCGAWFEEDATKTKIADVFKKMIKLVNCVYKDLHPEEHKKYFRNKAIYVQNTNNNPPLKYDIFEGFIKSPENIEYAKDQFIFIAMYTNADDKEKLELDNNSPSANLEKR